ncbi:cation:dicarboxylate symporter family transporter [Nitratifractor sp.]
MSLDKRSWNTKGSWSDIYLVNGLCLFRLFVTLMIILKLFSGKSPRTFLRKMEEVQGFAYSTSNSIVTIPVTLQFVTDRPGVHTSNG